MSQSLVLNAIPQNLRAKQVDSVRITVHSLGPVAAGGQLSQNHWTIELLFDGGCIRLDMTPYNVRSATDFRGVLRVKFLPYQLSRDCVTYLDFEVIGVKYVAHFTNAILEKARHRYNMTAGGVGCRHWISVVMEDWQDSRWIQEKTEEGHGIGDYIRYNWSRGQNPIELEVRKGTFY